MKNDCWLYLGRHHVQGYGLYNNKMAHRLMYETIIGLIPQELELDHLCRTPSCVNPQHLEPVTHHENIMRGTGWGSLNAKKTHCPGGHEYNKINTYLFSAGRYCKACHKSRHVKWLIRDGYKPEMSDQLYARVMGWGY